MIGIGFIGVGGMGRLQASAFAQIDRCRVVAGSDPSPEARKAFSEAHPDAKLYERHDDLLADGKVDAVVIAVPTGLHRDVGLAALKAGRPVLLEKPLARTVAECRELIDAADRTGHLLMVAQCRRFDENWGTLARVYRAGELGEQVLWRHTIATVGPGRWFMDDRLGGGPLIDGAIHDQDFGNHLFGRASQVVGGSIKFDPSVTAIDTGTALIQYDNGAQMMLCWSWAARGHCVQDVLGPKATFMFGPGDHAVPEGLAGHRVLERSGEERLVTFEPRNMYVTQGEHFLDCLEGTARCAASGLVGMQAVAVAEAVLAACRSGGVCEVEWPT